MTSDVATNDLSSTTFEYDTVIGPSKTATLTGLTYVPSLIESGEHRTSQTFEVREGRAPAWLADVVEKMNSYLRFEHGWDSYESPPPRFGAVAHAVRILLRIAGSDTPEPDVIPLSNGGIQIEWHRDGNDVEIEILGSDQASAYVDIAETGESYEGRLDRCPYFIGEALRTGASSTR